MKQHITTKQLNELSEKASLKLIDWVYKRGYTKGDWDESRNRPSGEHVLLPLSIGQLIEFLGDNTNDWGFHYQDTTCTWGLYYGYGKHIDGGRDSFTDEELCNTLWKATKKKLEE